MADPTISSNKVHIPLILVLGFILSCQGAMALYFFNQGNEQSTEVSKIKLSLEQHKASIDLRMSLGEQQQASTKEVLSEIKQDLKDIKRALVHP